MRMRLIAVFTAIVLLMGVAAVTPAAASPADDYTGTHFGRGNIPPGCENDSFKYNEDDEAPRTDNDCYHMRTGMNGLDSANVDVLIMVPASPTATRDMRIIRQAVEMWQGGIHYLAPQMGVPWMKNMKFNISTDIESAANGGGFVTYPIVDPEIVIIASNPVGGAGIGIDPWANYPGLILGDENMPCAGVANPFDMESWKGRPGYDHHGSEDGATVVEDCGGAGGNVCFALTPAIDPAPPALDVFSLFDLVAHEFGHCLTIGHVGDGAEELTEGGPWSKVPTTDIMSYNTDPPGLNKCVSTLDVEGIAVTQSHYIDTNGDGAVTDADHVEANEEEWDRPGGDHFQVQHPRDHFYASGSGAATDCPQPDLGPLPTTPTNWQPDQTPTTNYAMNVTGPSDGASSPDGTFDVQGTVERTTSVTPPTNTSGVVTDSPNDAHAAQTEIKKLAVSTTATHVLLSMSLKKIAPTVVTSPTTYSVVINGRRFDSFIRYPAIDPNAMTWDAQASAYLPKNSSTWFSSAARVDFRIPRSYLEGVGITAPYSVFGIANVGNVIGSIGDDRAPDGNASIGVAASKSPGIPQPIFQFAPRQAMSTVTFEHEGGNTFYPEQSTGGVLTGSPVDQSHHFALDLPTTSDVTFTLDWVDNVGNSDLDLHITGVADSGATAASGNKPEVVSFTGIKGHLDIAVEPYLITDELDGVTYTLTAVVNGGAQQPDGDGDGVPDATDACPTVAGNGTDGCPVANAALEKVLLYVDGVLKGSQDVNTQGGPDTFRIPVTVPAGEHTLRVDWSYYGKVRATATRQVSH